jgi:hypothetical protein
LLPLPRGGEEKTLADGKDPSGGKATVVKLPIVLGGGVYCPYDGKRLRLRNMPAKADPSLELDLLPDDVCRSLTTDLVFTPAKVQSLLKTMRVQEPMLLGCNLAIRDAEGNPQPDEMPLRDADESDGEIVVSVGWWWRCFGLCVQDCDIHCAGRASRVVRYTSVLRFVLTTRSRNRRIRTRRTPRSPPSRRRARAARRTRTSPRQVKQPSMSV